MGQPTVSEEVAKDRYRSLFEQVRDGVLIVRHGRILNANPAICTLLGYTEDELLRVTPGQVLAGPEDIRAILRKWSEWGEVRGQDFLLIRRDGVRVPARITARPCRNQAGVATEVLVLVQDLTERRNLERQLLHSQKMDALGRLAGGLAHDFKNLLSVTLGWVEYLGDSIPREDPRHAGIDEVLASLERARDLTRQLLSISRQRSDEPRHLDLNQVLRDMDGTLRQVLGKDVDLHLQFENDLPAVRVDPARLEQVLLNLVVNSREAMPEGGTLRIQTSSVWHGQDSSRGLVPGRYVRLSVEDTGCGIAPEVQAQVFEPFFTTKVDGSGLGLPAVGGAVRQAGGEVWVHSAPGKGARFDVDLPAAQAAEHRPLAARGVSRRSLMGGTILLVDDDAAFRTLVARMLEGCGYRVLQADGPQGALDHCASGVRIDLLMSDVCMPGASGPDLARRVRERSPGVPVLFTSGLDRASLDAVGDLPRAGFLEKPFRKNSLLASVRSLLESSVGRDRAGGAV